MVDRAHIWRISKIYVALFCYTVARVNNIHREESILLPYASVEMHSISDDVKLPK